MGGRRIGLLWTARLSLFMRADDGQRQSEFPPEMTSRIASAWTGQAAASATIEENTEEDQWTVSGEFDALRPLLAAKIFFGRTASRYTFRP